MNRNSDIEEQELFYAFTLVGSDPEECDVEYAFFAQAEVMLAEEEFQSAQADFVGIAANSFDGTKEIEITNYDKPRIYF
jgi:hypothetical protein